MPLAVDDSCQGPNKKTLVFRRNKGEYCYRVQHWIGFCD